MSVAGPTPRAQDGPGSAAHGLPPQARAVQGRRAGPVTRGVANAVDATLVVLVLLVGGVALFLVSAALDRDADVSALVLIGFSGAVAWAYLTASWATVGSTYGQSLMGLRVTSADGGRLPLLRCAARAWLCVLLPWLWFTILVSPRRLTAFDVLVRSRVIYDWQHRRDRRPDA